MALFERFHLSQEEVEARLKPALTGDPTRGEIGLLAALGANKYDDVQARLARDATLGADLRELVAETSRSRALAGRPARPGWSPYRFRSGTSTPGNPGSRAARSRNVSSPRSGG